MDSRNIQYNVLVTLWNLVRGYTVSPIQGDYSSLEVLDIPN